MESSMLAPYLRSLVGEWEDKGRIEGLAEGLAQGRAVEARWLLFKVLGARSFLVTPDVRVRIEGELDLARLESWFAAAVTAPAIGDIFRDS